MFVCSFDVLYSQFKLHYSYLSFSRYDSLSPSHACGWTWRWRRWWQLQWCHFISSQIKIFVWECEMERWEKKCAYQSNTKRKHVFACTRAFCTLTPSIHLMDVLCFYRVLLRVIAFFSSTQIILSFFFSYFIFFFANQVQWSIFACFHFFDYVEHSIVRVRAYYIHPTQNKTIKGELKRFRLNYFRSNNRTVILTHDIRPKWGKKKTFSFF